MDEISVRTLLLVLIGVLTGYAAWRDPSLGVALTVAVVVVGLVHELLSR
ncbi:hypothetical protein [Embleya sp. NPDC005575]